MKLLFDIEKVLIKIIEYLQNCEKSIDYWRSVRNSKSHILKNHCRDDRPLDILATVNKYISPILKKDEYFTSILKTCAFQPIKITTIQSIIDVLSIAFRADLRIIYPGKAFSSSKLLKVSCLNDYVEIDVTSNSISIRQKKKLKRACVDSNESVIDLKPESRDLSDSSSSNSDEDEDEDDELVRQIVDQIGFPESKIETDEEIKKLPSLISNSVDHLSDCQIKKSKEFENIIDSCLDIAKKFNEYLIGLKPIIDKISQDEVICAACPMHCALILNKKIPNKRGIKPGTKRLKKDCSL